QLPAGAVPLDGRLAAALRDERGPLAQLLHERPHPLAAAVEEVAVPLDLRGQHHRPEPIALENPELRSDVERGWERRRMPLAQTPLDSLYEANAGRVFAYCFARAGSRDVAEWAVKATFDRARAALSAGGIPAPELDWLLRTADKFCAPSLCRGGRAFESMVVLDDWGGRSFDEIADELEARYARLEEERNRLTPWRRLLGALNLGPAVSSIKGLVGGIGVVKAGAAAVAFLGAVAVVGTPLADELHDAVRPGSRPAAPASTPTRPLPTAAAGGPAAPARAPIARHERPTPRRARPKHTAGA